MLSTIQASPTAKVVMQLKNFFFLLRPTVYIFYSGNLRTVTQFNSVAVSPLERICVLGTSGGTGRVELNTIFWLLPLTDGDGREFCILPSYNNVRYIVHTVDQFGLLCAGQSEESTVAVKSHRVYFTLNMCILRITSHLVGEGKGRGKGEDMWRMKRRPEEQKFCSFI